MRSNRTASRFWKALFLGSGFLGAIAIFGSLAAAAPITVIEGASVFDSSAGAMLPGRTIVIEQGRITSVVARARGVRVPNARVIDATGKYVIPGMIDAHVHLVHVIDFAHVTGDEILPLFLANGITSIRDIGDDIVAEKLVARFADSHPESCPRVYLASPLIDRDPPYHRDIGRAVTDPEAVPAFVGDMAAWGVSTLKIYVGTERPVGRRIIEEGHRRGMFVAGHLGRYTAQDAVADGIDGLEHIWSVFNYIFPDEVPMADRWKVEYRAGIDLNTSIARSLIASLRERRVAVDPTMVVFRNQFLLVDQPMILENPDNTYAPQRLRNWWEDYRKRRGPPPETLDLRKRELRNYLTLTGMLYRNSVTLLAGTDTPEPYTPPGFSLHQELELFVESGVPPGAALQAATINTARALHATADIGSVEQGRRADLVILQADPTKDIRNTRRIWKVVKSGTVLDPQLLLQKVPRQ